MLICVISGFCLFNTRLRVTKTEKHSLQGNEKGFSPWRSKALRMLLQLKKKVNNGITAVRCDYLLEIVSRRA
jgi:hypothetical protein